MTAAHLDNQCDGARDCGTFLLEAACTIAPERLVVKWTADSRPTNPAVEALIGEAWQAELRRADGDGHLAYDGHMCRLTGWSREEGRLTLTLGPVRYREFIGTNATRAYIRYTHGPEVLADPLGASAALRTADGFLLLGRRSGQVAQYARRIHPVGGLVERAAEGAQPDVLGTAYREIEEELGIPSDRISETCCLGLVRDKHTYQPELLLDITVRDDAPAVRRMCAGAVDGSEHTDLVPVRDHPASVVTFIEQRYRELTPIALATLLLHGQRLWGSGWFTATRGYLRSVI